VTKKAERLSDHQRSHVTMPAGSCLQAGEHLSNELAMVPLFVFDLFDANSFVRIDDGTPMAAVGVSGCLLG
jgi:hypothetical protein